MAKTKQTPPGLNAGSVYLNAFSSLTAAIEQPDDFLRREVTSGTSASVAYNKGGLLQRDNKEQARRPAPQLRAEQQAFLDVAKARLDLRQSKGKT